MPEQQSCDFQRPTWEETERLEVLARYSILDTAPEPQFDDIVQIAAQICDAPISLISLVEEKRQWFKAKVGLEATETPIGVSICAHAILRSDIFIVPDTHLDSRFKDNPLVTGDLNLRFYAGAPIVTTEGLPMGMMCVLDHKPRTLTESQQNTLKLLAQQVMRFMDLRQSHLIQARIIDFLRSNDDRLQTALNGAGIGTWYWDIACNQVFGDASYARLLNITPEEAGWGHPVENFIHNIHPDDRGMMRKVLYNTFENGDPYSAEYRIINPDGSHRWISSRGQCHFTTDGKPYRLAGCSHDLKQHSPVAAPPLLKSGKA